MLSGHHDRIQDGRPIVTLPPVQIRRVCLKFHSSERKVYEDILQGAIEDAKQSRVSSTYGAEFQDSAQGLDQTGFPRILSMRQACVDVKIVEGTTAKTKSTKLSKAMEIVEEITKANTDEKIVITSEWLDPLQSLERSLQVRRP